MALLHHLARTGGTLISRCLASMDGVCLLSEINPLGTAYFNPLRQAAQWYGLVSDEEVTELEADGGAGFYCAMDLLRSRAQQRELHFVIRDWSHLDWVGFPFVPSPPLQFSWDQVHSVDRGEADTTPEAAADFSLFGLATQAVAVAEEAAEPFAAIRCATVRHPVDQYLSSRALELLQRAWDEEAMWRGMHQFAEGIQGMPWFRYEDFLAAPEDTLEQICAALLIPYDSAWKNRWPTFTQITGNVIDGLRTIAPAQRAAVAPEFWSNLRGNQAFFAILDLLGYPTPEPLRRKWWLPPRWQSDTNAAAPTVVGPSRAVDWDGAAAHWRRQYEDDPRDVSVALRLAEALCWIGQPSEAADLLLALIPHCEQAATESLSEVLAAACEALEKAERKYEAIAPRRLWAKHEPNHRGNLFQLSLLLAGVGEVEESLAYSRHLLMLDRMNQGAAANFLLYLNYSDRVSAAEVSNEHFRIAMRFTERPEPLPIRRPHPEGKIRVGYLSSDFYTHPVGKIILPLLQAHDRTRFQIHVYHDGKKSDANTDSVQQAVDQFTTIHGWSDSRVFEAIRNDQVDILIDLGGYTGGGNRLRVLAKRAAPVQASFLGYPNTSAVQTIDYHLTDRFADPPGLTEHLYGEQLVWLQHAHLAWRPYEIASHVEVPSRAEPIVGVFNNVAKISPSALDAYAMILRRVPEAKMVFKYGDRYQVPLLQDRYRRQFAQRGVLPNRLEFHTRAEPLAEHLKMMMATDLALDAFPYQGTMTSLECLSVGTPILSCCGQYYAHRATSAMMMRMQFHELVAADPAEYVEIAVQLLHDLPTLRGLRSEILRRFYEGPLTDPEGLTRELEAVYASWSAHPPVR